MRLHANLPYRMYGPINIVEIKNALVNLDSKLWQLDTSRQDAPQTPHQQTNSIILKYCFGEPEIDKNFWKEDWVKKSIADIKSGKIELDKKLRKISTKETFIQDINQIEERMVEVKLNSITTFIVKELEQKFKGISGLVLYTKLPKNTVITKHTDPGYYLSVVHRLHIPIFTNDKCYFDIDNNIVNMKEGYLYELNNQVEHSVKNDGDSDRIHLIIDIIPNKLIEQFKTRAST